MICPTQPGLFPHQPGICSKPGSVGSEATAIFLPPTTMLLQPTLGTSKLVSDQLHLPSGLLEQKGSWGESVSPWFPAGTNSSLQHILLITTLDAGGGNAPLMQNLTDVHTLGN